MSVQIEITTTEVGTTEQVVQLIEVAGAGPQGATTGIIDGGTTGQVLAKASDADQDTEWTSDIADAAQGQLADSAVQPGDPVSDLTNDANYIDAAGAPVQSVDGFTGAVDLSGEYDALGSASSVQQNLTDHENATTNVHGIADTSQLIVEGDARLTDQRVPVDGSVTSAKIDPAGISPASVTGTAVIDSDARLSDERTPVDESVTTAKIDPAGIAPSAVTGTAVIDNDARLSDNRTPVDGSVTDVKVASGADIAPTKIAGTAVIDSDARLSDERTPLDGSVTNAKVAANAAIDQSKIDGLAASLNDKANLVSGKVPQSELPAIALTDVNVVADIPARDALTVEEGDVAIVQDTGAGESSSFVYDGTAWQELLTPGSGITAVTASEGLASTGGTAPEITIVDGGVTNVKLAGSIDPSKITGTAVVDADARLSEGGASAETVRSLGTGATQALPGDFDVAGQAPVQSVDGLTGAVDLSGEYDALGSASAVQSNLTSHINDTDNPHSVTKAQVGLGDVDNVSAADLRDRATHTGTQTLATISDAGTIASQNANSVSITGGSIDAALAYDNTNSTLTASLVETAIDELDAKKLDTSALTASVKFFPTTAAGAVAGYGRLVTDTGDADYDDPAVAVTVGPFSGTGQLLGELVSDAGVLDGNTTPINVTTIGNVRRSSGNTNDVADFFFEVYKRDSGGTETLIGTSSNTAEVNQSTFQEFFADALIDDTNFTATDRVVLKFYGNVIAGGGGETYEFQYGGNQPVRTLFPVPVTVVPRVSTASDLQVDASGFSGLLSGSDDDAQSAFNTLDAVEASDIAYDNTANDLTATDLQDAIDEIVDNAKVKKYFYTATASQTTFTGADDSGAVLAYSDDSLDVFINGVRLSNADYTATDGTSVVLDTGANANDEVAIVAYGFVLGGSGAKTFTATVTGSSDWTGSDPYIATITVNGILSTDTPVVDLNMSNVAFADVPDVVGEFGLVYRVEASADDEIKLYATAEPTQDFDLTIQVVR